MKITTGRGRGRVPAPDTPARLFAAFTLGLMLCGYSPGHAITEGHSGGNTEGIAAVPTPTTSAYVFSDLCEDAPSRVEGCYQARVDLGYPAGLDIIVTRRRQPMPRELTVPRLR